MENTLFQNPHRKQEIRTHWIRRKHDEQSTHIESGFTALIADDHMPTYHIPNKWLSGR